MSEHTDPANSGQPGRAVTERRCENCDSTDDVRYIPDPECRGVHAWWACARCRKGDPPLEWVQAPGRSEGCVWVPAIPDDSWLHRPQYEHFRLAYRYAQGSTLALDPFSHVTAEQAYWIWYFIDHGMKVVQPVEPGDNGHAEAPGSSDENGRREPGR